MVEYNKNSLELAQDIDVLFLPLHRLIDSNYGGEFIFPLRLAISVIKAGIHFSAVCGTIDSYSREIVEKSGNTVISFFREDPYLKNKRGRSSLMNDFLFYLKILRSSRVPTANRVILHHAFPLGYEKGFNPRFLLEHSHPKVLGPLLFVPDPKIESRNYTKQNIEPVLRLGQNTISSSIFKRLYYKTISTTDVIIFDSSSTRRFISDKVPETQDKDFLILPSCGIEVTKRLVINASHLNSESLKIGIITYLRPRKRVDTVLKALNLCKTHDINLDIVGDGPSVNYLKGLVNVLQLSDRVRFLGKVDHSSINEAFDKYDLIVHLDQVPHLVNSTTQEALSRGKPIIFSEDKYLESALEFPYGWQVDPDDPSVLTELFEYIDSHRETLIEKSKNALEFANLNMSYDSVGRKLLFVYKKLME